MLWRGRSLIRGRRTSALVSMSVVACASFLYQVPHLKHRDMDKKQIFYPDFDHAAYQLSAFILCIDIVIISLKNGEIIRFKPVDIAKFGEWLKSNGVRDVAVNDGLSHTNETTNLSKSPNGFFKLIKRSKRK